MHRHSGVKLDAHPAGFGSRMAEAVIADGAQSLGQDMAKIAPNELNPRERQSFGPVGVGTVFPAEGDRVLSDIEDAGV